MSLPPGDQRDQAVLVDTSASPRARLRPVPADHVRFGDGFWGSRLRLNRTTVVRAQYHQLEETEALAAFRRSNPKQPLVYRDSDVYKWIEAASWCLASFPDPELAALVDGVVADVESAQEPDGYLNTYFAAGRVSERFTNFDKHELYCAGHLFQAAVAHRRATGSGRLLAVATRYADLVCDAFGPVESGRRPWIDGHEEVKLGLVELHRVTGNPRYLDQARYFLDARGHGLAVHPDVRFDREYYQDHHPFRELTHVTGHAVRMVYLAAAAADLFAETGDASLRAPLLRLWEDMVTRRMYVSGGIGSRYLGEAFGADYELPNALAYAETCAAIGTVMWSWRMLALDGEARFADQLEHTLLNAVLPGISLDGDRYFYQNPLSDDGRHRRQPWFGTACCPPNIARTLASLPGYAYSSGDDDSVWVHLYHRGEASIGLRGASHVSLRQETDYPWRGDVSIEVRTAGTFALRLRIPGWCGHGAQLRVNGSPWGPALIPGTYAELRREWTAGDNVRLHLPMPVRLVQSHPWVEENGGQVALMRGPVLYCFEEVDNQGSDLRSMLVQRPGDDVGEYLADLLGGVVTLAVPARVVAPGDDWVGKLYRPVAAASNLVPEFGDETVLTAVPYMVWANRDAGQMRVWMRGEP